MYTGRYNHPEIGLMYFRARYYDPQTGEFISRDPLGYVDGMSQYRAYFVLGGIDPLGHAKQKMGNSIDRKPYGKGVRKCGPGFYLQGYSVGKNDPEGIKLRALSGGMKTADWSDFDLAPLVQIKGENIIKIDTLAGPENPIIMANFRRYCAFAEQSKLLAIGIQIIVPDKIWASEIFFRQIGFSEGLAHEGRRVKAYAKAYAKYDRELRQQALKCRVCSCNKDLAESELEKYLGEIQSQAKTAASNYATSQNMKITAIENDPENQEYIDGKFLLFTKTHSLDEPPDVVWKKCPEAIR